MESPDSRYAILAIKTEDNPASFNVFLTIVGDIDGDRDADIFDIVLTASNYSTKLPDPNCLLNCDIDGDGDIDIFDLVIATGNYGKSW